MINPRYWQPLRSLAPLTCGLFTMEEEVRRRYSSTPFSYCPQQTAPWSYRLARRSMNWTLQDSLPQDPQYLQVRDMCILWTMCLNFCIQGNVGGNQWIVQVTKTSIVLLKGSEMGQTLELGLVDGDHAVSASCSDPYIRVVSAQGHQQQQAEPGAEWSAQHWLNCHLMVQRHVRTADQWRLQWP